MVICMFNSFPLLMMMNIDKGKLNIEVILLGAAQDCGFPQVGCSCSNCEEVYSGRVQPDSAVSLAVIDHSEGKWWLFEASPQLNEQWRQYASSLKRYKFSGILL
jgi:pyrroloquinoline quinone biosynthesis protein B